MQIILLCRLAIKSAYLIVGEVGVIALQIPAVLLLDCLQVN
jgi:hypothetical protein